MLAQPLTVFSYTQVAAGSSVVFTQRIPTKSLKLLVDLGTMSFEVLSRGNSVAKFAMCGVKVPHTITSVLVNNLHEVTILNNSNFPVDIDITPINDTPPIIEAVW